MQARDAIANLIFRYAQRLDAGDLEGMAELFAHGEVRRDDGGSATVGTAAVLAMYRAVTRIYEDTGTPRTKHVTTNLIIEVDDEQETGSCHSYFTVFQQTPDLPLQAIIAGRYHDRFHSIDGEWCFASRQITCDLFGDLSHHLLIDASTLIPG
jgi:3-phenylpropionate/cinnamic acid dioxygenase small subunit